MDDDLTLKLWEFLDSASRSMSVLGEQRWRIEDEFKDSTIGDLIESWMNGEMYD